MKNKKILRRLQSICLSLLLILSMFSAMPVNAAGITEVIFGEVTAKVGDEVTVPVSIKNNPGIASFRFRISYDTDVFEFISATEGPLLTTGTLSSTTNIESKTMTFQWFAEENIYGDGELVQLKFKVLKSDIGDHSYNVTYLENDIVNDNLESIPFEVNNVKITIICTSHTYDNDCDTECNVCHDVRTITHKYEWVIDKANNCGIDGIKHEECSVCHTKRNENTVISATGNHSYDNTCDAFCNICGYVRSITHNYEWVIDKQETCGESGLKHEECTVCHTKRNENTAINATGNHDYKWIIDQKENCGIDGAKHEECTICHAKRNENTKIDSTGNHVYSGACDTECNVCHTHRTSTTEHTYSNENDLTCNVCGEERANGGHIYDNDSDMICNGCGYDRSVPDKITSNDHTVGENTISKITAGTTVEDFISNLNEGQYCKVFKGNEEVANDVAIGTGMKVKIMDGDTVKAEYTVIVTGDTNGDGDISVTDLIAIKSYILGKANLSNEYAIAADTSGDRDITITDFIQIKAKILGIGEIIAR